MTRSTTVQVILANSFEDSLVLLNVTFANSSVIDLETTSGNLARSQDDDGELNNWWAMLALVLVLGTAAGNILVCLAIAWERRLQNVTNYFLMSLAITDLMVAILVMPLGILTLVRGELSIKYADKSLRIRMMREYRTHLFGHASQHGYQFSDIIAYTRARARCVHIET